MNITPMKALLAGSIAAGTITTGTRIVAGDDHPLPPAFVSSAGAFAGAITQVYGSTHTVRSLGTGILFGTIAGIGVDILLDEV